MVSVRSLLAAGRGAEPNRAGLTVGPLPFGLLASMTPLSMAVNNNSAEMVQAFLGAGADPNQAGRTFGPFGMFLCEAPLGTAVATTSSESVTS